LLVAFFKKSRQKAGIRSTASAPALCRSLAGHRAGAWKRCAISKAGWGIKVANPPRVCAKVMVNAFAQTESLLDNLEVWQQETRFS